MNLLWTLIFVVANDASQQAGAASIHLPHATQESCLANYDRMVVQADKKGTHILLSGCYYTGK